MRWRLKATGQYLDNGDCCVAATLRVELEEGVAMLPRVITVYAQTEEAAMGEVGRIVCTVLEGVPR